MSQMLTKWCWAKVALLKAGQFWAQFWKNKPLTEDTHPTHLPSRGRPRAEGQPPDPGGGAQEPQKAASPSSKENGLWAAVLQTRPVPSLIGGFMSLMVPKTTCSLSKGSQHSSGLACLSQLQLKGKNSDRQNKTKPRETRFLLVSWQYSCSSIEHHSLSSSKGEETRKVAERRGQESPQEKPGLRDGRSQRLQP